MGTISVSLPADGTTADVADVNTPITTIVNEFNGNIDNNNIKSGAGIAGSKLADSSVTASKLATGSAGTTVATSETTTTTTYTDLATVGPAQAVTIGTNGVALVSISCAMSNSVSTTQTSMGFAVSGATTVAASDAYSIAGNIPFNGGQFRLSGTFLVTGLTPGTNTFTAKFKTNASTATFSDRRISVVPL